MAISELKGERINARLFVPVNEVESEALDQVRKVCSLPWVAHCSIMPDVHAGKGCTVGSVIGMRGAVSPATVGVDIGCGMAAIKTNLTASMLPDNLKQIRNQIERDIPVGFNRHDSSVVKSKDGHLFLDMIKLFDEFDSLDSRVQSRKSNAISQIGSLGGGNHFIEICLDKEDNVWFMLHSGSRNIGKELAEIHIEVAKELEHNQHIIDRDLAVFLAGTQEMENYRRDLYWAQRYALMNRQVMMHLLKGAVERFYAGVEYGQYIACHHNYVAEETHYEEELFVTRKGAIRAGQGDLGIIPGSMGTKSYIVRGLGNPESLCSASHGAGRRMSRGKAKKTFTLNDLLEQTKGVECRKDTSVIDEIPGAYKNIDRVMEHQSNLVEVVAELKQILCVKG